MKLHSNIYIYKIMVQFFFKLQKSYIYMKVGSISSFSAAIRHAIDTCFVYEVLSFFSYKGKTKRSFIKLKLFSIIYGKYLYTL